MDIQLAGVKTFQAVLRDRMYTLTFTTYHQLLTFSSIFCLLPMVYDGPIGLTITDVYSPVLTIKLQCITITLLDIHIIILHFTNLHLQLRRHRSYVFPINILKCD